MTSELSPIEKLAMVFNDFEIFLYDLLFFKASDIEDQMLFDEVTNYNQMLEENYPKLSKLSSCIKYLDVKTSEHDVRFPAFFGQENLPDLGYIGHFFPVTEDTQKASETSKLIFFIDNPAFHFGDAFVSEFGDFREFERKYENITSVVIFILFEKTQETLAANYLRYRDNTFTFRYDITRSEWKVMKNAEERKKLESFIKIYHPEYKLHNFTNPPKIMKKGLIEQRKFSIFTLERPTIIEHEIIEKIKKRILEREETFPDEDLEEGIEPEEPFGIISLGTVFEKDSLEPNIRLKKSILPILFLHVESLVTLNQNSLKPFAKLIDYFGADKTYLAYVAFSEESRMERCSIFINHVQLHIVLSFKTDKSGGFIGSYLINKLPNQPFKRIK